MKKFIVLTLLVLFVAHGASTRFQYFETWTTKLANQDLTITPSGTGSLNVSSDLLMTGTGVLRVPVGTEAQRPTGASGDFRFNSDSGEFEGFDGSEWGALAGSGGGAGTVKIIHQEKFETDTDSTAFTCGTNLTASDETSAPIANLKSIDFDQGGTPASASTTCAGPTITLDEKPQSKLIEVCFNSKWDGNDNEMRVDIVPDSGDTLQIPILASTTPIENCGNITLSSTVTTLDYDIVVVTGNDNTTLRIDDLEIQVDPPVDIEISNENPFVFARSNAGTTLTANVTPIDFIEVTDAQNLWDSNTFTAGVDGVYTFQGVVATSSSVNALVTLYKSTDGGSSYTTTDNIGLFNNVSSQFTFFTHVIRLDAGDKAQLRLNPGGTLTVDNFHTLSIIGVPDTNQVTVVLPEGLYPDTCYVKDVKSSGNDGGAASATTWNDRTLNTTEGDCSFLSLSSNDFTLESGAYNVECNAPAFRTDQHKIRLRQDPTGTPSYPIYGSVVYSFNTSNATSSSLLMGRITISSNTGFDLQHYTTAAKTVNGLGIASSDGTDEVYAQCKITKIR